MILVEFIETLKLINGLFFGHTYCITTSNSRHFHVLYSISKIAAFLLDTQFVSEFSKQGTIKKQEEKTCEKHTQLLDAILF